VQPALTLPIAPWMRDPALLRVLAALNGTLDALDALNAGKGAKQKALYALPSALIVGGAVRNYILNKPVYDIDIACVFAPEVSQALLVDAGIKVIPTGIQHGTITAVMKGRSFEITTLRRDVKTDGRHAEVAFTQSWREDAERRDFTMNALFMDVGFGDGEGRVYDPLGQGLVDAQAGIVRFVGNADQRIQEDYLRILRFFRMWALYGHHHAPDSEAVAACAAHREGLGKLSRERVSTEIMKMIVAEGAPVALQIMAENGILTDYIAANFSPRALERLAMLQTRFDVVDPVARLIVMAARDYATVKTLTRKMILSRDEKKRLQKTFDILRHDFGVTAGELKRSMYFYGRDVVLQSVLIDLSSKPLESGGFEFDVAAAVRFIMQWPIPVFPIAGDDLKKLGYAEGPEIGEALLDMQQRWIDSDFSLSKDSLIMWLKNGAVQPES